MSKKPSKCSVIIVTHDSEKHIGKAMQCLQNQTSPPHSIILVDTGSQNADYLVKYRQKPSCVVIYAKKEAGFCRGNNIGMMRVPTDSEYVFFLNPDAFLTPTYLENAQLFLENPSNRKVGAMTGLTYGYDIEKDEPTGKYDSTGVFQTWYGKWYDRAQGEDINLQHYQNPQSLPAICGAVFLCRKEALQSIRLKGDEVMDSSFYMYKEDIDLSLRLREKGWDLKYEPNLVAYHCRGWNPNRRKMPRRMRLCSAQNELRINFRQLRPMGWLYSSLKFLMVKLFDM